MLDRPLASFVKVYLYPLNSGNPKTTANPKEPVYGIDSGGENLL
jgi:hypothetical protein